MGATSSGPANFAGFSSRLPTAFSRTTATSDNLSYLPTLLLEPPAVPPNPVAQRQPRTLATDHGIWPLEPMGRQRARKTTTPVIHRAVRALRRGAPPRRKAVAAPHDAAQDEVPRKNVAKTAPARRPFLACDSVRTRRKTLTKVRDTQVVHPVPLRPPGESAPGGEVLRDAPPNLAPECTLYACHLLL